MFIDPERSQIKALAESGHDGPVVMLNLLRYERDGGEASYQEYGKAVLPHLARVGARLIWQGTADSVVIGDDHADAWDAVLLVEYPSRKAFLDMVLSAEYQQITHFRAEGLEDSRLIACTETFRVGG